MQRKKTLALLWLFLLIALSAIISAGCGDLEGTVKDNQPPIVEFVTVPQDSSEFSYAPVVYWRGNDPDGFVEYYSYADVTDNAAFENPIDFYTQIPDEAWNETMTTQARIYLMSEEGERQEHIFYIRCYDDKGMVSDVKYRTFYRTNQAPRIPEIGLVGSSDDDMGNNVYIADTLFSGTEITETWGGISFTWRGSDPDDRSLYTIPLEFQSILVKSPGDTIFVNPWDDDLGLVLSDLETGFYTLYVWSRDDGFTLSPAPGRIEFNVIKPSFEHRMLLVIEAAQMNLFLEDDELRAFYENLLNDALGSDIASDTVDVKRLFVSSDSDVNTMLSSALVNQYQLVVLASDLYARMKLDDDYLNVRDKILTRYLRVGGRLWIQGRFLAEFNMDTTSTDGESYGNDLLTDFMMVDSLHGMARHSENQDYYADFVETRPAITGFSRCLYDTSKNQENFPGGSYLPNNMGLVGAEIISRKSSAETTQYYVSYSADLDADTTGEDCSVLREVVLYEGTYRENEFTYPPTSTDCYLSAVHHNINQDGVTRIENITLRDNGHLNYIAELMVVNDNIMKISYEEGIPWNDTDVLEVDYSYDPVTEFHLKPVEVRYERSATVNSLFAQLRYRTALTTFSYYFVNYESAVNNWRSMLDWFYYPQLHQ